MNGRRPGREDGHKVVMRHGEGDDGFRGMYGFDSEIRAVLDLGEMRRSVDVALVSCFTADCQAQEHHKRAAQGCESLSETKVKEAGEVWRRRVSSRGLIQ